MKTILAVVLAGLGCVSSAFAQLVFLYDQESANESTGGGGATGIQASTPVGQSFTPQFSSVSFIRLKLHDVNVGNDLGATLTISLRTNSITGPILGFSDPVVLPDTFNGYPDFLFSTPVSVTPGVTYFFQPLVETGDAWAIAGYNYEYSGGTAFVNGVALLGSDLWFREGVVVPEPGTSALGLLGAGTMFWFFHRRRHRSA